MILGIIVFILSSLGIYGFFNDISTLLYIALAAVLFEYLLGYFSGQLKNLGGMWFAIICALGMITAGYNWLIAISLCLCFENIISFILGLILMFIVSRKIKKE